jgi:hypothetical protein
MLKEWPTNDIVMPFIFWRDQEHIGVVDMKKQKGYSLIKSPFNPFEVNGVENQNFLMEVA